MAVSSIIAAACVASIVFVSHLYIQATEASDAHTLALQTVQNVSVRVAYAQSARICASLPSAATVPAAGPAYDTALFVGGGRLVYTQKNTATSAYTDSRQTLLAALRPDMMVNVYYSSAGTMVLHVRVTVSKSGATLSANETNLILNNLDPSLGVPGLQVAADVASSASGEGQVLEFGRQS